MDQPERSQLCWAYTAPRSGGLSGAGHRDTHAFSLTQTPTDVPQAARWLHGPFHQLPEEAGARLGRVKEAVHFCCRPAATSFHTPAGGPELSCKNPMALR